MDKRTQIITEAKTRLLNAFPGIKEYDGQAELRKEIMPLIGFFEAKETSSKYGKRAYRRSLFLTFEYANIEKDSSKMYEKGRTVLKTMREALEIDDSFSKLCISFEELSNHIVTVYNPMIVVRLEYKFDYFDGYNVK